MMVPFTEMANARGAELWNSLERETEHYTPVRLVEIPLDIQMETTSRSGIYEVEGQRWRVSGGGSLGDRWF